MTEFDLESVVKAINRVNDNIWLGDFEKAREIAHSRLETLGKTTKIAQAQETANALRSAIRENRKLAREKRVEKKRLWVAEQVSKEIKEKKLDPIEGILGALLFRLADLEEAIGLLIEAESQAVLEDFSEESLEERRFLRRGEKYRYTLRRLPDRWEVRGILESPTSQWNLRKIRDQLSDYGLFMEGISRDRPSGAFEVYSRDMYTQVFGHESQVTISIHAIATEDRVISFVENIMKILAEQT